jgi:hypothetical protein
MTFQRSVKTFPLFLAMRVDDQIVAELLKLLAKLLEQ